jgi:hypothetical protein
MMMMMMMMINPLKSYIRLNVYDDWLANFSPNSILNRFPLILPSWRLLLLLVY